MTSYMICNNYGASIGEGELHYCSGALAPQYTNQLLRELLAEMVLLRKEFNEWKSPHSISPSDSSVSEK